MTLQVIRRSQEVRDAFESVPADSPVPLDEVPALDVRFTTGEPVDASPAPAPPMWRLVVHAVGAFVTALSATLCAFVAIPVLLGYGAVVVASDSMEPALFRADVVLLGEYDGDRVGPGTVIDVTQGDRSIIHRVIENTPAGYRTQGDNNPTPDSFVSPGHQVNGVGAFLVPFAGLPGLLWQEGRFAEFAALLAVLMVGMHVGRTSWLRAAEKQRPATRVAHAATAVRARS